MTIRVQNEQKESLILSPFACRATESQGRLRAEAPCTVRTCFQRDIDRIVYSKAFRRLKHKTQVFLQPEGDHYRTRMTHTLEVSRIARTIARGLSLNEDLTEAIALGHDLGHTPFGHAGEAALSQILPDGFRHNEQSLRVIDHLEKNGRGLNLTQEVRDGILCHTGKQLPETLEGQVIRFADRIAYINHDIDDAIRAGIMRQEEIPSCLTAKLGDSHRARIDTLIKDILETSMGQPHVMQSPSIGTAMEQLRQFMFQHVYRNPKAKGEESKAKDMLLWLFEYYSRNFHLIPADFIQEGESRERMICDYIAGMTDQYAIHMYSAAFIPLAWQVK